MKFYLTLLLSASSFKVFTTAMARNFTVTNNCTFTIWPAINTGAGMAPDQPTGWSAAASSSVSFTVPDNWSIGRIWARRDCIPEDDTGRISCLDGWCPGGLLLCDAPPNPPVTVADFALSTDHNVPDHYDVALVNGYNLPMRIDNNAGCGVPQCPVDLGPNCPAPLKEPLDSTGFPVGCMSACDAGLAPDPKNDHNCCTGMYDTAATCLPANVQYYSYFKSNCPDTYVYDQDQQSGTSYYTCPSASLADYTVTFCP
ncbi:thaumatin-like protein [Lactarius quietus]|nr:thaumatin-like protein [Lactarius quietus]